MMKMINKGWLTGSIKSKNPLKLGKNSAFKIQWDHSLEEVQIRFKFGHDMMIACKGWDSQVQTEIQIDAK